MEPSLTISSYLVAKCLCVKIT